MTKDQGSHSVWPPEFGCASQARLPHCRLSAYVSVIREIDQIAYQVDSSSWPTLIFGGYRR